MIQNRFHALDAWLKQNHPRAYPWIWFVGLYGAGFVSLGIFAYGLRWLIKG